LLDDAFLTQIIGKRLAPDLKRFIRTANSSYESLDFRRFGGAASEYLTGHISRLDGVILAMLAGAKHLSNCTLAKGLLFFPSGVNSRSVSLRVFWGKIRL
jgi:hypothetical protein